MSGIDPEFGEEQQLFEPSSFEDVQEANGTDEHGNLDPPLEGDSADDNESPASKLGALLEDNGRLLNELITTIGPSVLPEVQLRFLDVRLQMLSELVFQAVGNQHRAPFAIEYELRVNQLLDDLVSQARQAVLQI